jgi:hypothetical protein
VLSGAFNKLSVGFTKFYCFHLVEGTFFSFFFFSFFMCIYMYT